MKSDSAVSYFRNVTVSCAKCSTAMRIFATFAVLTLPEAEAHTGMREATRYRDRRAVGAPAGRACEHAVLAEPDRVHAAPDGCHLHDLMAHRPQFYAHGLRNCLLDLERVALGPDPRGFDGLLQAHAVIDQIDQGLHRAREDA